MEIQWSESFCPQLPSCIHISDPLLYHLMSFIPRSRRHISELHMTRVLFQIRSLTPTLEMTKTLQSCTAQRRSNRSSKGRLKGIGNTRRSVAQRKSNMQR